MIDAALLSPAWPLIVGGFALPFVRGRLQDGLFVLAPVAALVLVWTAPDGSGGELAWLGLGLELFRVDPLARLFGTAFALAALAGALFGLGQKSVLERAAVLIYAGNAEGVVFAGDLATLFLFWEAMAIGSTLVIWANGAERAGLRYALMHVLGGVLLLAGIAATVSLSGDSLIRPLRAEGLGAWLLLAGLLVNAGAPPVSAWVADAYPRASWSGAVFLSAFTTKAAVVVLIRLFPGEPLLIGLGLVMAVYGLVYALLENDIRRVLAYSIVGQVGFMLVAIGIGTPAALAAAAILAFTHILYKSLLMMAAGSILRAAGTTRLTRLGGLARKLPVETAALLIGGFSLAAVPFTAGFASKSALLDAAAEGSEAFVWFALTALSAGSFLYAGLKLPHFAMLQPGDATASGARATLSMRLAMVALAALLLLLGCFPAWMGWLLSDLSTVAVLTADHVAGQFGLLAGATICYILLLALLRPVPHITLDLDWLWRDLPRRLGLPLRRRAERAGAEMDAVRNWLVKRLAVPPFSAHRAMQAANWRTGDIALLATAILGMALLIAAS